VDLSLAVTAILSVGLGLEPEAAQATSPCGYKETWLASYPDVRFKGPVYQEIDVLKWIGLDFSLTIRDNGKASATMNTSPGIGEDVLGTAPYRVNGDDGVLTYTTTDSYRRTKVDVTMTPTCSSGLVTSASVRVEFDNGNNVPHHFVLVSKEPIRAQRP
jgi:hypothetical protein